MATLSLVLMVIAFALFLADALGAQYRGVKFQSLGLAAFMLALMVGGQALATHTIAV